MTHDPVDRPLTSLPRKDAQLAALAQALSELYQLLEEYAPAWYTQQHRERAKAALGFVEGVKTKGM